MLRSMSKDRRRLSSPSPQRNKPQKGLRYRRKEILDRLQHSFGRGVIKKISFRVG